MSHSTFVMPFTAAIRWIVAAHGSLDTRHPKTFRHRFASGLLTLPEQTILAAVTASLKGGQRHAKRWLRGER